MPELRADNVASWDPAWFDKADPTPDELFYQPVRLVTHIDEAAILSVTQLYRELLPGDGVILDLMSSWVSHLPPERSYQEVVGQGMNGEELTANPQLDRFIVQNLNRSPNLPFADKYFDAVCCCVSVQYMQKPIEIFREVRRVLKPNAPFVLTFSNRCFPTKAINLWRYTSDEEHMQLVSLYFAASGGWSESTAQFYNEAQVKQRGSDPLYAVYARAT